jgi:hypothetical protein
MSKFKYTIIINSLVPDMNFSTWEEVMVKSKELCKQEIKHIIRDNEFNVSVRMGQKNRFKTRE